MGVAKLITGTTEAPLDDNAESKRLEAMGYDQVGALLALRCMACGWGVGLDRAESLGGAGQNGNGLGWRYIQRRALSVGRWSYGVCRR